MSMTEDLSQLDSIEADIVLETLKNRHQSDLIYTRNGSVLIAINPYKRLPIYRDEELQKYKASLSLDREPPHVFAVAAAAHRSMISDGTNQALIISGESGAGKTETASFLLQYLRFVTNASNALENRIYASSPLTEAFGCAKTLRNDNSSRFGKFLMLQFDQSAKIQGAVLSTYLLEKSRVSHVGPGERSYHIFYCMLRGATDARLSALKLSSREPKDYKYLLAGETGEPGGGRTDRELFAEVETALGAQGFSAAYLDNVWQLLAGVMHLGSISFDPSKPDAASVLQSSAHALPSCEAVLGLQPGVLLKALCKRKLKVVKEWVEQDLSVASANDNRDALSKAIYSRLFDRVIAQINTALAAESSADGDVTPRTIGIVDIFGFEVFVNNSLEQLCINFANEKLQALFTRAVFKETIEAYKQDGIDAAEITFTDNAELLKLIEAPQTGVLSILSEECLVPKGSDGAFCEKVHEKHAKSKLLTRVKGKSASQGFGIAHFAGPVTYSTENWLDKNKDPLSGDLEDLMRFSGNALLAEIFAEPEAAAPAPGRKFKSTAFKGVINTFQSQLKDLVSVLEQSSLHFVRCFKPNDKKVPDLCETEVVARQLHTSGVLDALRVARTGFPDRQPFADFCGTFAALYKGDRDVFDAKPEKERCVLLLKQLEVPADKYRVGKERIFFASGMLSLLREKRVALMASVAIVLQAGARGLISRVLARELRSAREAAKEAIEAAIEAEDVAQLRAAIADAKKARLDAGPIGAQVVRDAEAALAKMEAAERAKAAATEALTKALATLTLSDTVSANTRSRDADVRAMQEAIGNAAACKGFDALLLERGRGRLKALQEEEERRVAEVERRRQEEARLAALAAAEKAGEEKKLAEERRKREEEEARKVREAAAAEEELMKQQEQQQAAAAAEAAAAAAVAAGTPMVLDPSMDEEAAAQRAIEEEEELRGRVLRQLEAEGISYKSATEDVLEYAVYLGMMLPEDINLLWIADEALQADDPEGWEQHESPNGDVYYVHEVTKQRSWQHPLDYQYQQLYLEKKAEQASGVATPAAKGAATPSSVGTAVADKTGGDDQFGLSPGPGLSASGALTDEQLKRVLQNLLGTNHADLKALLSEPANCKAPIRCFVQRHKSRMGGGRYDFFMSISKNDDMYCFTAKKHSVAKGCYYSISLDQDDQKRSKAGHAESFIGKVRSDRKSLEYTLYDDGVNPDGKEKEKTKGGPLRRELLYVNFINSLRNRNPGAMLVVVPRCDGEGNAVMLRPTAEKDSIGERSKRGDLEGLVVMKNREPKWNPVSNMYQLDFHGRATMASCKNIQLHPKDGEPTNVSFLMGKVEENKFNVDFKGPFSCLQAFAFALIVFDNSSGAF